MSTTTTTSTGPRTDEGKARAAQNSLKHGLTGAGKCLPAELAAEVDSRKAEFADRFHPRDAFATFLVGQLALASVRIENCQRLELEMTEHLRNTSSEHQADNDDRLAAYLLYNRIHRDPPTIRLQLIQTPAGRDILVRKICNLIHGLPDGRCNWTDDDLTRALDLLGFSREERHLDPQALATQGLANLARDPATPLETRKAAGTKLLEELNKAIKSNKFEAPDPAHAQQKQSLSADGRWFHNHDDLKRLRRLRIRRPPPLLQNPRPARSRTQEQAIATRISKTGCGTNKNRRNPAPTT